MTATIVLLAVLVVASLLAPRYGHDSRGGIAGTVPRRYASRR